MCRRVNAIAISVPISHMFNTADLFFARLFAHIRKQSLFYSVLIVLRLEILISRPIASDDFLQIIKIVLISSTRVYVDRDIRKQTKIQTKTKPTRDISKKINKSKTNMTNLAIGFALIYSLICTLCVCALFGFNHHFPHFVCGHWISW